ncbi:hypothetical protein PRIPAC_84733 [Pristionchus pacificus]|uniref:Uncharacterized protein n=1 Tax=Pristionchus pacificus TaxID=54126 RepID=A0A2A6BKW2_PRIPA|nr:hypothetical protein PRIPAC_84733 [Pristionchus pacificus]|eukprot:PDM66537.1 hypothetical protein PRIPAC_47954 [Pristionchus pacificus]
MDIFTRAAQFVTLGGGASTSRPSTSSPAATAAPPASRAAPEEKSKEPAKASEDQTGIYITAKMMLDRAYRYNFDSRLRHVYFDLKHKDDATIIAGNVSARRILEAAYKHEVVDYNQYQELSGKDDEEIEKQLEHKGIRRENVCPQANALTRRDATIYGLICGQLMLRQRAKERENGNEIECPNCITMHILQ